MESDRIDRERPCSACLAQRPKGNIECVVSLANVVDLLKEWVRDGAARSSWVGCVLVADVWRDKIAILGTKISMDRIRKQLTQTHATLRNHLPLILLMV
ncbi:hypothetical protein AB1N83_013212 [Pleurotus pulmonarius]